MPAYAAKGTALSIDGTEVGRLTSVGGVGIERDELETTAHDSAGGFKEFIMGLRDSGTFEVEFQFDPEDAGQLALMEHANEAEEPGEFVITYPAAGGYTWTFDAWVMSYNVGEAPVDDVLTGSASIRITGIPVLAAVTVGGGGGGGEGGGEG
jgi:hypothetical protein